MIYIFKVYLEKIKFKEAIGKMLYYGGYVDGAFVACNG